jgi:L-fuculose-phosphate aldolase
MSCSCTEALIATARALTASGLTPGTSGNVSARSGEGFVITPTGVPYERLEPAQLVTVNLDGSVAPGQLKPSSEWRLHRDIYLSHGEAQAIVHVHSPYATALACARREIPAFHYMVAMAGGDSIPCAPYATFGTQLLSDHVTAALKGRRACLMANHGMVALGENLEEALRLTQEVESLARQYCVALQLGGPVILPPEEMRKVLEKFQTYGKQ